MFAPMAQRLNRRSVSFNVLPRDSSGDVDILSNVGSPPAIDRTSTGNIRRRRRKQKSNRSSMSDSTLSLSGADLRYDCCPDDRYLYANSLVPDRGGAILESDETAVGQEGVTPLVDGLLTDYSSRNMHLLNGALASSGKQMEADIVLSQLQPFRERNGNAEYASVEQLEFSTMPCISDSSANSVSVATREKGSECEQLLLLECRQGEKCISESGFSPASPQDEVRNLQLLPSLTTAASHPTADRTASNGDGFCHHSQTTEDLPSASMCLEGKDSSDIGSPGLNSEVQESMGIASTWSMHLPRSGLRQRTGHALEESSSGVQSENALKDFILKDDGIVSNKDVSEGVSALDSKGVDQECEQCDPPDVLAQIPDVRTGPPQLSEWERLMAGSQPANVAPLRYFFGEVMQARALQNTQSVENDKKRQHVYNTMFHVPWRCELLIIVGFFVCLDSFLSLLTVMPLRFIVFLWRCAFKKRQSRRPHADELSDLCSFLVLVSGVTLLQQAVSFIT